MATIKLPNSDQFDTMNGYLATIAANPLGLTDSVVAELPVTDPDSLYTATTLGGQLQEVGAELEQIGSRDLAISNLFDADNVVSGYYVQFENGNPNANAGYCYFKIPVTASTKYTSNPASLGADQIAFFTAGDVYISGLLTNANPYRFTTPANAAFATYSVALSEKGSFVVVPGDVLPNYIPRHFTIDRAYLDLLGNHPQNTIIVAKSGGDYTTITAAVTNANSSESDQVTIIVCPGVYEEVVVVGGSKHISIVGVNKLTCILRDDTGNYNNAPLRIEGNAYVANMTIIATHDDFPAGDIDTLTAYAVHADDTGNGVLEINNCILVSYQEAALGAGLYQDQSIVITNCELYSYTPAGSSFVGDGALYCHSNATAGTTGQHLIVRDCLIRSENSFAIHLSDSGSAAGMDATFIGNSVYSDALLDENIVSNAAPIAITPYSSGNNIKEINANKWAAWTPTLTWDTATPTGVTPTCRYKADGGTCHCMINIHATDGNNSTGVSISLPKTPSAFNIYPFIHVACRIAGNTEWRTFILRDDGSNNDLWSLYMGTATGGSGFDINMEFFYEFA